MANIKINKLEPLEIEFAELSDLELEGIVGGKGTPNWIKKIEDGVRSVGRKLDDAVRENVPGGWIGVIGSGLIP